MIPAIPQYPEDIEALRRLVAYEDAELPLCSGYFRHNIVLGFSHAVQHIS